MPSTEQHGNPVLAITAAEHPLLFEVIEELRAELEVHYFVEVSLACSGSIEVFPPIREQPRVVLYIGLPLLGILTVGELRSLLAYSFRFAECRTSFMGRAVMAFARWTGTSGLDSLRAPQSLPPSYLSSPRAILWKCADWFTRKPRHEAFKTCSELETCNRLEAGLEILRNSESLVRSYWDCEYSGPIARGCLPPLFEGWCHYVAKGSFGALLYEKLRMNGGAPATAFERSNTFALDWIQKGRWRDARREISLDDPAITLLADLPDVEGNLNRRIFGDQSVTVLKPISWERFPAEVLYPEWKAYVQERRCALVGLCPESFPDLVGVFRGDGAQGLSGVEKRFRGSLTPDLERLASLALAVILIESGAKIEWTPGRMVELVYKGIVVWPFLIFEDFRSDSRKGAEWREHCRELSIDGIDLGLHRYESEAG